MDTNNIHKTRLRIRSFRSFGPLYRYYCSHVPLVQLARETQPNTTQTLFLVCGHLHRGCGLHNSGVGVAVGGCALGGNFKCDLSHRQTESTTGDRIGLRSGQQQRMRSAAVSDALRRAPLRRLVAPLLRAPLSSSVSDAEARPPLRRLAAVRLGAALSAAVPNAPARAPLRRLRAALLAAALAPTVADALARAALG
jgi:hypothetical protein